MKLATAAALVFLLALPFSASAQTFDSKPFLSVQGHAEAKVKPDIFPLEVTIAELGMDPAKAQKTVEDLAARALEAAKANGLTDADIEIGNLDIGAEMQWDEEKKITVFRGNNYERRIGLKFRSLDSLRKFIESMPMSRNLHLATGTFEFSGADELRRKLRREAIADARKGAQEMADAVGKRLVDLFNVSDRAQSTLYANSGYSSVPVPRDITGVALLAPGTVRGAAIVLREGEITVSADAYLVYLIGD